MKEPSEVFPIVIDVETTMKCPVGNNKANPFWPENDVVLYGLHRLLEQDAPFHTVKEVVPSTESCVSTYIGHNVAFDLHYFLVKRKITTDYLARCSLWDTQLAEYLLSGQTERYPTLDNTALKYGGTLKDDFVKSVFASGAGADAIRPDILKDYLKSDLMNTSLVFKRQWVEAETRGMLPLLLSQMEARQATIDMIWNGLAVDRKFLEDGLVELTAKVAALRYKLENYSWLGRNLDLTSPTQLSKVLFGGAVKEVVREQVGTYKNGKPKYKNKEQIHAFVGHLPPATSSCYRNAQTGNYTTDDKTLTELLKGGYLSPPIADCVENVLTYRELNKELTTYYEGIHSLIMPDGLIHHNLNHCVTRTGRLSSSDPNLQNVTDGSKSKIKKAFVSRWGDDGVILEADYGQLEMVMLAVLTGDEQLMQDITDGVDMHTELYRGMYHRAPTKEERKPFKRCSFALVYGAGANGIAEQGGITKKEAQDFIDVFYTRYPKVKLWHEQMYEAVVAGRYTTGKKDAATGLPVGESCYVSPMSHRNYVFHEYVNSPEVLRWKKQTTSFSPTEVKNYPVQGGATGDIVPLVLGKLYRVLRNNPALKDKCLLINTVHDSVLFDVHKSVLTESVNIIKQVMENAPTYIKETFKFNFPLPLKVGISYGPNWLEQTEVDFTELERKAA